MAPRVLPLALLALGPLGDPAYSPLHVPPAFGSAPPAAGANHGFFRGRRWQEQWRGATTNTTTDTAMTPACSRALAGCWPVREDEAKCKLCEGKQQHQLRSAGCSDRDIDLYCREARVDPTSCLIRAHPWPGGKQCGGQFQCYRCPNASWQRAIEATGLLSVKDFGALGDSANDDAPAVRAALNATRCCGGCVFFPPGVFRLNSTVSISGCVKGATGANSGIAQSLATTAGSAQLIGPAQGPALAIIDAHDGTLLQDLNIQGKTMVSHFRPRLPLCCSRGRTPDHEKSCSCFVRMPAV